MDVYFILWIVIQCFFILFLHWVPLSFEVTFPRGAMVSAVHADKGEVSMRDSPSHYPVLSALVKLLFKGGKQHSSHLQPAELGAKTKERNERVVRPKLESMQKKKLKMLHVGNWLGCMWVQVHTDVSFNSPACYVLSSIPGTAVHHDSTQYLTSWAHRQTGHHPR